MFCRECGFELYPLARYCERCGSRTEYNLVVQPQQPQSVQVEHFEFDSNERGVVKMIRIPLFSIEEANSISNRFIAFDVETTGLSKDRDRVIQIGAVKYINGQVEEVYSTLINPCMHISEAASRVCHITDDMVASAPKESEVLYDFLGFLGDALEGETALVAHNASFDMGFLSEMLERNGQSAKLKYVDTLDLSRRIVKDTPNYKQLTIAKYFGIEICNAHQADDDARVCGSIFTNLVDLMNSMTKFQDQPSKTFIDQSVDFSRGQNVELSVENKGICAYILKILKERGQDVSRVRFSLLATGVNLMYPYKIVEFRVSKKWIIRITYRAEDGWEKNEVTQLSDLNDYADLFIYLMNEESNEDAFEWYYKHRRNYQQLIESTFTLNAEEIDNAIYDFKSAQLAYLQDKLSKQKDKEELDRIRAERRIEREKRKTAEAERKSNSDPHPNRRRIAQYDDDMNLITVFDSIAAAETALNTNSKSLRDAATGKQKHAAGYIWRFVENDSEIGEGVGHKEFQE